MAPKPEPQQRSRAEDFKFIKQIGKGSFGVVYQVERKGER